MCDIIFARVGEGRGKWSLFGKNSDRDYREAQHLLRIPAAAHRQGEKVELTYTVIDQSATTYECVVSKPHWIWGAEMGANEHGLVIGNEAILTMQPASLEPGIIGMDYLRLALERARNVDEAIEVITSLLKRHGQSGNAGYNRKISYNNSFMIADRTDCKILETVDRDWAVRKAGGIDAISNALTIEQEWENASKAVAEQARAAPGWLFSSNFADPKKSQSGVYRRSRALEALSDGSIKLAADRFFSVLRDHKEGPAAKGGAGPRICAHRADNPIGQTTASWVSEIGSAQSVHWVTGTAAACTGIFKPLIVGRELPPHGPTPGDEPDEASLWWRHEKLRQLLEVSSVETLHEYQEECSLLEGRFIERTREILAACPETRGGESGDIVEQCWDEALSLERRWAARLESAS